eukprot:697271-Rhodomonas_salina.1
MSAAVAPDLHLVLLQVSLLHLLLRLLDDADDDDFDQMLEEWEDEDMPVAVVAAATRWRFSCGNTLEIRNVE